MQSLDMHTLDQTLTRAAGRLARLAAILLAAFALAAPGAALAQGKGKGKGHYKEKHYEKHHDRHYGSEAEARFMREMLDLLVAGARLAELGASYARDGRLDEFCHRLVDRNHNETEKLERYLNRYYGEYYRGRTPYYWRDRIRRLQDLRGVEFDHYLLRLLVDYHREKARLALEAIRRSPTDNVRGYAREVAHEDRTRAWRLEEWLREWHYR